MKKRFQVNKFVVLGLVLLLLCSSPLSVSSKTNEDGKIIIEPGDDPATTCQDTIISVRVENMYDLYAYSVQIKFDPNVINIVDATNGSFLETANEDVFFEPTNAWDNEQGTLSFGMTQISPVEPKSGAGELINITLRAITPNAQTDLEIHETSILVRWSDVGAIPYISEVATIQTESCSPNNMTISNQTIIEYEPVGTLVGTLTTFDPDFHESYSYNLVDSANYPDNQSFQIVGDQLLSKRRFVYDDQSFYTIKIQTEDPFGKVFEKDFTIEVIEKDDFMIILPFIYK